jgi:hypothetical protein
VLKFSCFQSVGFSWIIMAICLPSIGQSKAKPVPVQTVVFNAQGKEPAPLLDTTLVRKLYMDGDFDQAIEILETGLKAKPAYTHHDSVFIFKHLGVMYAAKYETREKGKYFMHQLLAVEPTARILDMYASDMIYMIFKNIQDEYEETRGKLDRAQSHVSGNSQLNSKGNNAGSGRQEPHVRPEPTSHHAFYWVGGTAVAVAVGVGAYFILADSPGNQAQHGVQ